MQQRVAISNRTSLMQDYKNELLKICLHDMVLDVEYEQQGHNKYS